MFYLPAAAIIHKPVEPGLCPTEFQAFFFIFTLYSSRHLTYRGLGRAIPLHALQTTVKVFIG